MTKVYVLLALGLLLVAGCVGQPGSAGVKTAPVQNAVVVDNDAASGAGPAAAAPASPAAGTNAPAANATPVSGAPPPAAVAPSQSSAQPAAPPSPYGDVKALPQSTTGSISIPVSELSTTIKKYSYDIGGTTVRFFAVIGSDGKVRTAFDACEVCYRNKKGYTQVGSDVQCNNCGRQFQIDELGTANKGTGCWPGYLPSDASGGSVAIKVSDLQNGAYLFP